MDSHSNFGYTTVLTAPSPATSGTSLTVATGTGSLFPAAPFNCTVWPAGTPPLSTNAEIVRVTNVSGDTLTIQRAQEGTSARTILAGDQIANTITVKVFTDIEDAIAAAITTQTVQTQNMVSIQGSTGNITFSNANNVTFGFNASVVTASASFAGGGGGAAISAGANSQSTGTVVFSNSNGVTFGLSNDGMLTASHNGLTSQSNQAFSAAGGSSAFQTLNFRNANGISFSNSNGSVEASYTVPTQTTQPGIQSISGGTTRATTGEVVFSNSNGVSFGVNGNTVTASHNGLTQQSTQPVAASAANGSFAFSTLSFSNVNGISFGTSAGSAITASHNGLTSQSVQTQSNVQGISAGTQVARTGDVVFSNSNGVTFGMSNNSVVTASYTVPSTAGLISAVNLSGGTTSNNLTAMVFSNSNGVSFGLNGSTVTATVATNYQSQGAYLTTAMQSNAATISNINLSAGTTSNNLSAVTFDNAGGVSFGLNGSVITASAPAGGGGLTNINFSAGTTSQNLSQLVFLNSNNITFGLNGSTVTASAAAGGAGSVENYVPFQLNVNNTSFSSFGQNTAYFQFVIPDHNVTFAKCEIYARGTFASSTNSQAYSQTIRYGLYSQGTGASSSLMTQVATSSIMLSASFNSNTAAGYTLSGDGVSFTSSSGGTGVMTQISGPFHYYMPFTGSMASNTKYAFAMHVSSTTAVNTAAMRFAPLVMTVQNSLSYAKLNQSAISAPSATNYGDFDMVAGTVTTNAMPSSIAFSAMSIAVSRQKLFIQFEV